MTKPPPSEVSKQHRHDLLDRSMVVLTAGVIVATGAWQLAQTESWRMVVVALLAGFSAGPHLAALPRALISRLGWSLWTVLLAAWLLFVALDLTGRSFAHSLGIILGGMALAYLAVPGGFTQKRRGPDQPQTPG